MALRIIDSTMLNHPIYNST